MQLQQLDIHEPQISSTHHRRRRSLTRRRRSSNWLNHFPDGSLVEVRTNEKDFKGVYFAATLISSSHISPKKGSRNHHSKKQLYVEYHNLLDDQNESKRLKELVDLSFVRPAPPFLEIVEGFEQDDAVDAFYKDGWWTGVVKRVVERGARFVVTFRYPPDELEFGFSDLRVHWDWVNGSWIRPEKKSTAGLMFDMGRKVEVSFDREDRQGAWFPATIHKDLGNGAFLVEYCSSDIKKKDKTVKVTIDSLHVRPCPPLLKDNRFVLLEKVDAFFEFGWWSGVITKVLENSRYIVFFKQTKREKEFDQSELRPHMEWKDGRWFTSSQLSQDVSDDGRHGLGDRNDTSDDKTLPNVLSQPRKKHKGDILGSNERGTRDRSIRNTFLDSPLPVSENDGTSSATQTSKGNQSSDNSSWRKGLQRKQRKVGATSNAEEKSNSTPRSRKKGSTQASQVQNSGSIAEETGSELAEKEADAVGNSGEDVQTEHDKKETELPVIIGLPCAEMGSSRSGISRTKRAARSNSKEIVKIASEEQQQLNDSKVQEMKDSKQPQTEEVSEKKKRGRPRKTLIESTQTQLTGNTKNGGADLGKQDDDVFNKDKLITADSESKNRTGRMTKRSLTKLQKEKVDSTGLQENRSSKRGRKLITDEKISLQDLDSLDASVEADKVVRETSSNEFENEPLSKWIEGVHSPPINDTSRQSPVSTMVQCTENSKRQRDSEKSPKQLEIEIQVPALQDKGSILPSESQSLPFVKNVGLWKTIESMEVFQRIPQRPHFKPLAQFKESSREGLAIGYMVTFSSTVEKASKLQVSDPESMTDDILETLADLESHGFDVKVAQDRVRKLVAVRDKQGELIDELKELKGQIVEHDRKKSEMEKEIREMSEQMMRIDEEIREMNEKKKKMQEKISHVELAKKNEDIEIAFSRARLEKVEECIKSVEHEFE